MAHGWEEASSYADRNWRVYTEDGRLSHNQVIKALLIDIRRELKSLNSLLHCHNTLEIPRLLRKIRANTNRIPVKKAKKAVKRGKK